MAERAATHRERLNNETAALVGLLRFAIHLLEQGGNQEILGWMFDGERRVALDAVRRHRPELAGELEAVEARAKAYVLELGRHCDEAAATCGPTKGSIVVGGSVFSADPNGWVRRDGRKTSFRVVPAAESWRLVEERSHNEKATRGSGLGSHRAALLGAATLVTEREKGGPLAAICPPLGTWIPRDQQFPRAKDSGPPPGVQFTVPERDVATRSVPLKAKATKQHSVPVTSRPSSPSDSAHRSGAGADKDAAGGRAGVRKPKKISDTDRTTRKG